MIERGLLPGEARGRASGEDDWQVAQGRQAILARAGSTGSPTPRAEVARGGPFRKLLTAITANTS